MKQPLWFLFLFLSSVCLGPLLSAQDLPPPAAPDPGDGKSLCLQALTYTQGQGIPVDPGRAIDLFKQSAAKGYPGAEVFLARIYEKGWGTPADPKATLFWYEKAANDGDMYAQAIVGKMYVAGTFGKPIDYSRAREWFEKSVAQKSLDGNLALARLLLSSESGMVDRPRAYILLMEADPTKTAESDYLLALLYSQDGPPIRQNKKLAWIWLCCALAQKEIPAGVQTEIASLQELLQTQLTPQEIDAATKQSLAYRNAAAAWQGASLLPDRIGAERITFGGTDPHPFRILHDSYIVVPLMINGRGPFDFILDTGSSTSVVQAKIADSLRLEVVGNQSGLMGDSSLRNIRGASLGFFDGRMEGGTLVDDSFEHISSASKENVAGLLGYDFIRHFVIEVDYSAKTIRFLDPGTYSYNGPGIAVPITLERGIPYIHSTLEVLGHPPIVTRSLIDTGSDSSIDCYGAFTTPADFKGWVPKAFFALGERQMINGSFEALLGRLQALDLGSIRVLSPAASYLSEQKEGADVGIGARLLHRFKLTIDYPHDRIYFDPNNVHADNAPFWVRSLDFAQEQGSASGIRVSYVTADSNAAKADVEEGDIVMQCDDLKGTRLTLAALLEGWSKKRMHQLTLRRGDQSLKVKVELETL